MKTSKYLRIPIAPGDNIIGNGLSKEYFSHRLAKARRIRPCATYNAESIWLIRDNYSPYDVGLTRTTSAGFSPFIYGA